MDILGSQLLAKIMYFDLAVERILVLLFLQGLVYFVYLALPLGVDDNCDVYTTSLSRMLLYLHSFGTWENFLFPFVFPVKMN